MSRSHLFKEGTLSKCYLWGVLMLCRSAFLGVMTLPAAVAADEIRVEFDIPAQPLVQALRQFAEQTGLQLVYETRLAEGRASAPVHGMAEAREALEDLLSGTRLQFEFLDARTVALSEPRPATYGITSRLSFTAMMLGLLQSVAAPAQSVPSSQDNIETVNVFASMSDSLSIGSKSGQSLRETPKSVSIVTRERLEEQNLTSLSEALMQTNGVTVVNHSASGAASFFYSRGFRVQTVQLDGGAAAFTGNYGINVGQETAAYERVEMLRGVDGMFSGAGAPGGVINLVRKRAKSETAVKVALSAGSWDAYRGEFDATGALTSDGKLRGRAVAAYSERDYIYDLAHSEKTFFYGTLEYDLTPSTLLIAGATYDRRKEDGDFSAGMPRYSNGGDLGLPRETALTVPWARWHLEGQEYFARVEQQLGDSLMLKFNATRIEQETVSRTFVASGLVNPVTLAGPQALTRAADNDTTQDLLDLSLSGSFQLFGGEHRFTLGTDYVKIDAGGQREYRLEGYVYGTPTNPLIDVFNFDGRDYPAPVETLTAYYPALGPTQQGIYGALDLQLAQSLRLSAGGRYGRYRFKQAYQAVDSGVHGTTTWTRYDDEAFIPSVALRWNFANNWTAYASFAETFEVQSHRLQGPPPGTPIEPVTGDGFEVGIKGELFNHLNVAAALYRIKREGQAMVDPAYASTPGQNGSSCCYLAVADVETEGFEAEVSGTITPGWQMFAGYSFYTNEYSGMETLQRGVYVPSGVALTLNRAPKHMLKLWSTWQLPGHYSRWKVNGGVVMYSPTNIDGVLLESPSSTTYVRARATQDTYAVFNASVLFDVNDVWSVGIYGDNIFDKKYYQVLGFAAENNYGNPRTVLLTVRANF